MSNNKTTICLRYGNLNGYQLNVETKGRWAAYCKDQIRVGVTVCTQVMVDRPLKLRTKNLVFVTSPDENFY